MRVRVCVRSDDIPVDEELLANLAGMLSVREHRGALRGHFAAFEATLRAG